MVEKISVALPLEMVVEVRTAVEKGEYSSTSEVIREALRDWTLKRNLHHHGLQQLRAVWRQALENTAPGIPMDEVLDRLDRQYEALAAQSNAK